MALLTWAALVPSRRWALIAAGMSLAALLDTGAGWLPLAPIFPLYYAGLMWSWHQTPILRSFCNPFCVVRRGLFQRGRGFHRGESFFGRICRTSELDMGSRGFG